GARQRAGEHARGLGTPGGGGPLYHPDYSVEPIRQPLVEVSQTEGGGVRQALLLPGAAPQQPAAEPVPPDGPPEPSAPAGSTASAGDSAATAARRELGYSIGADGVIEVHPPERRDASADEPIN